MAQSLQYKNALRFKDKESSMCSMITITVNNINYTIRVSCYLCQKHDILDSSISDNRAQQ